MDDGRLVAVGGGFLFVAIGVFISAVTYGGALPVMVAGGAIAGSLMGAGGAASRFAMKVVLYKYLTSILEVCRSLSLRYMLQ